MNGTPVKDQTPGHAATNFSPQSDPNLLEDAHALWSELLELSHDHFRLAALETQRAGVSLVTMLVAGVMLALLLNVVWFGLMAVVVISLIESGFLIGNAILLAIACSLMLVLILIGVIRYKSRYLQYPAILRSLKPKPPVGLEREKV